MSESTYLIKAFGLTLIAKGMPDHRSVVITKAIKINERVYLLDAKGCIRTARLRGKFSLSERDPKALPFLRAAAAFGLFDKEKVEALRASMEERRVARERGSAADNILRDGEIAGVSLTAAQRRFLKKVCAAGAAA